MADWTQILGQYCTHPRGRERELLEQLHPYFGELAEQFNRTISQEALMINVSKMRAPDRLSVATMLWALSLRAVGGTLECFLIPTAELSALMEAEVPSRCKLRLVCDSVLLVDGTPVQSNELITLLRSLLKDLIARSQGEFDELPESMRIAYGAQSLTGSVRSLVAEKHVLVQKIVNQQEAILSAVARELHDTVLGNLLVLERSLAGGRRLSDNELTELVKEASTYLREVCQDLYPRDLKDCGIAPMLQELCSRLRERTGCRAQFVSSGDLPKLPDEVLLHLYRIAQECCNNIAKHASADFVQMHLVMENSFLTLTVSDNGKGFDASANTNRSGMGVGIIRERTELIDCSIPAQLWVDARVDEGTTVRLQLDVSLLITPTN